MSEGKQSIKLDGIKHIYVSLSSTAGKKLHIEYLRSDGTVKSDTCDDIVIKDDDKG
jgi:hypothetical protein